MSKATEVVIHSLSRTFSVICTLLVIAGLCWAIYVAFVRPTTKPNPSTTQNAEQIKNYYIYPNKKVFGFGFTLWGMDIGLMKYDYPKEATQKQNVGKR